MGCREGVLKYVIGEGKRMEEDLLPFDFAHGEI
jgi:hypothetical protein